MRLSTIIIARCKFTEEKFRHTTFDDYIPLYIPYHEISFTLKLTTLDDILLFMKDTYINCYYIL